MTQPTPSPAPTSAPGATTLNVSGMTCGHCERAVTQAIRLLDPAAQVQIDRTTGRVQVLSTQPAAALAAALAAEGYPARPETGLAAR